MPEDVFVQEVFTKLSRIFQDYRTAIDLIARRSGLFFGQTRVLEEIAKNEGCTQTDIASALTVSAPSIAASMKRLEKGGFILRKTDPTNLRIKKLYLTDAGRIAVRQAGTEITRLNTEIIQHIGPSDREIFLKMLDGTAAVLERRMTMDNPGN